MHPFDRAVARTFFLIQTPPLESCKYEQIFTVSEKQCEEILEFEFILRYLWTLWIEYLHQY